MLVNNNQSSTNWNSSFSKQEQGNSNEVFNLEFPSKIEISSDTKIAKKLEINRIEYPQFPSSNLAVNTALTSAVSQTTAVNQTTATAYGYSVDSKGFMGADFNKAAGLPDEFKIHKSTLDTIIKNTATETKFYNQLAGSNVSVVNIDVANTIGQYYSLFTQVIGSNKTSFSSAELGSLPSGYVNDKMIKENAVDFWDYTDASVTHIFSANDMAELESLAMQSDPSVRIVLPWKLDFSSQHLKESRNGFDMSVYKSNDGYSVENLFVSFIDSHGGFGLKGGETEFSSEFPKTEFLTEIPVDKILADQKKYDDLLASAVMLFDASKDGSVFSKDYDENTKKLLDAVKAIYARARV